MSLIQTINSRLKNDSRLYWWIRECYVSLYIRLKELSDTPTPTKRKRVLFYHINSLGHAGTEKFIQILAKYLDKNTHEVFYLYPENIKDESKSPGTYFWTWYRCFCDGGSRSCRFSFFRHKKCSNYSFKYFWSAKPPKKYCLSSLHLKRSSQKN